MESGTLASPYARVGAKLIDNGFSAIALLPATKRPADFKWSQYCDNLPEDHKVDAWGRAPSAGVGIACGFNGVVALDFDTDDPAIVDAIESVAGKSFIQKRGNRGFTGFYRASAPIEIARLQHPWLPRHRSAGRRSSERNSPQHTPRYQQALRLDHAVGA